jgi:regulator of cell morphogenesis and NO signaling
VNIRNKKITELVGENYVYASVLYYFGIKFYDYSEKTLFQVCQEKGLDVDKVIVSLESVNTKGEEHDIALYAFPIDLIIEYLKHTHYIFIKQKLPYIAGLIQNLKVSNSQYHSVEADLKFVFPIFVEDFIHHIYEEEDTLFTYLMQLYEASQKKTGLGGLFYQMEKYSIQRFAVEHDVHDDEMEGIRKITDNYSLSKGFDLHLNVLYSELKNFEQMLITHAKVENEILFPKGLMLEKEVNKMLKEIIRMN